MSFASEEYFSFLFTLCDAANLDQRLCAGWYSEPAETVASLIAGLVTSADTGNEDLVVVSRAALARVCRAERREGVEEANPSGNRGGSDSNGSLAALVIDALVSNLRRYVQENQDRVVLPTLEVLAYLFHVGILPGSRSPPLNLKRLCLLVQKAAYKTGSVRKLEACIRVYGEIARLDHGESGTGNDQQEQEQEQKRSEGAGEAKRRLSALLLHPWPRVRSAVVDELWVMLLLGQTSGQQQQMQQSLAGVDWSKADKAKIKSLVQTLGLEEQQQQQHHILAGTA